MLSELFLNGSIHDNFWDTQITVDTNPNIHPPMIPKIPLNNNIITNAIH